MSEKLYGVTSSSTGNLIVVYRIIMHILMDSTGWNYPAVMISGPNLFSHATLGASEGASMDI